jgi:hypothetical protein
MGAEGAAAARVAGGVRDAVMQPRRGLSRPLAARPAPTLPVTVDVAVIGSVRAVPVVGGGGQRPVAIVPLAVVILIIIHIVIKVFIPPLITALGRGHHRHGHGVQAVGPGGRARVSGHHGSVGISVNPHAHAHAHAQVRGVAPPCCSNDPPWPLLHPRRHVRGLAQLLRRPHGGMSESISGHGHEPISRPRQRHHEG